MRNLRADPQPSFALRPRRPTTPTSGTSHARGTTWPRLLLGLAAGYAVLQGSAQALGSVRGEAGLIVGALTVVTCLIVERVLHGRSFAEGVQRLGLGRSTTRAIIAALAIAAAMVTVLPVTYAAALNDSVIVSSELFVLTPGILAQAGIAEETLFRGYLFRHLRERRSFWRAALIATVPFAVVHLLLFLTMPWPIALAALALSIILGFPLAHLFEVGKGSIWAPAILHTVIQGAIKVIVLDAASARFVSLVWMAAAAVLPFAAFLVRRPRTNWDHRIVVEAPAVRRI